MKRKSKIKILKEIQAGRIPIDFLKPPKHYVFIQRMGSPGIYEMDGEEYSREQVREFEEMVRTKNDFLYGSQWSPDRPEPGVDFVVIVEFLRGKTIL